MACAGESKDSESAMEVVDCAAEVDGDRPFENLHQGILENIFRFLKYEKTCEIRLVCKSFDEAGKTVLEKGKSKVEMKLEQHLAWEKFQLLRTDISDYYKVSNGLKYTFLYLIHKSRYSFRSLFREFLGKNVKCFTLGKMIDFLKACFVVLKDDQLFDCRVLNLQRVLYYWRTTYDSDQMKQIGPFDFCVFMWLKFGEFTLCSCDPVQLLFNRTKAFYKQWEETAEGLARNSGVDIPAMYEIYKRLFRTDEAFDLDLDEDEDYLGDGEEQEEYESTLALQLNENWGCYEPPEMNQERLVLFKKYLYRHLHL